MRLERVCFESEALRSILAYAFIGESFARMKLPELSTLRGNKCVKTKE